MGSDLQQVFSDIAKGKRIDKAAALSLLLNASPVELGFLAQERRFFHHPEPAVTYIIDRNINYTNICETLCAFCAFSCAEGEEGAYSLSIEDLLQKVKETVEFGGTGILLQGGHNPRLPFGYYTEMLSAIKRDFPDIHIHAFSRLRSSSSRRASG